MAIGMSVSQSGSSIQSVTVCIFSFRLIHFCSARHRFEETLNLKWDMIHFCFSFLSPDALHKGLSVTQLGAGGKEKSSVLNVFSLYSAFHPDARTSLSSPILLCALLSCNVPLVSAFTPSDRFHSLPLLRNIYSRG